MFFTELVEAILGEDAPVMQLAFVNAVVGPPWPGWAVPPHERKLLLLELCRGLVLTVGDAMPDDVCLRLDLPRLATYREGAARLTELIENDAWPTPP